MVRPLALSPKTKRKKRLLRVAGLFAGIGGIEQGLHLAGHETELLCEIDESARAVLAHHFPNVTVAADIRDLHLLPPVDLVTAGFSCQDLSQAGKTAGIAGTQSGLVGEVFRLIENADIRWLLLENVPFMLQLDKGKAMRFLTAKLEELGFAWAYRTSARRRASCVEPGRAVFALRKAFWRRLGRIWAGCRKIPSASGQIRFPDSTPRRGQRVRKKGQPLYAFANLFKADVSSSPLRTMISYFEASGS